MDKVTEWKPRPGRLLVLPALTDTIDHDLMIELPTDQHQDQFADVVLTSDPDEFPVGCQIVYDRIHGKDIDLKDENGDVQDYKVVLTADVSLIKIL